MRHWAQSLSVAMLVGLSAVGIASDKVRSSSDIQIHDGAAASSAGEGQHYIGAGGYEFQMQPGYVTYQPNQHRHMQGFTGDFDSAADHINHCNTCGSRRIGSNNVPACPSHVSQNYSCNQLIMLFECPSGGQVLTSECVYPDRSECTDCPPTDSSTNDEAWSDENARAQGDNWVSCKASVTMRSKGFKNETDHHFNFLQAVCN